MRIIARQTLREFDSRTGYSDHRALKGAVDAWYAEARKAHLVVAFEFVQSAIYIKWIGTHRDYEDINVETIEYDG